MGVRTGQEYLDGIASAAITVEIHGELTTGKVAEIPAFRNLLQTYAGLYDLQHDPALRDVMTYDSPSSVGRVGMSFLEPESQDDVVRRRRMMEVWARASNGMLGRTGDYLNAAIMAMAGASDWFAQADPAFGANIRAYYEHVREHDLLLTHTLIMPQANRSKTVSEQADPYLAARIVEENDNGVVIRGARMLATIGPIADELVVMPSTVIRGSADDAPYAYAFAIPTSTPGCASSAARASTSAAAVSTTLSAPASRRSTRSSSSTTCSSRTSAASSSATRTSATASTPRPRRRRT